MKKLLIIIASIAFVGTVAFAVSYKNNTYQKLADEYTRQAQAALNAGRYDESIELSKKAEENAALSRAYIDMMLAKKAADDEMKIAQNKIAWAKSIDADKIFRWRLLPRKTNTPVQKNPTEAKTIKPLRITRASRSPCLTVCEK